MGRQGAQRISALLVAATLAAGCVGAIDRAEFDEEVRRRGGGVSSAWIEESLDAVARELALADWAEIEAISVGVNTQTRSVTVTARRGDRPDFVDVVTVQETDLLGTSPVPDADDLPLDDLTVNLGDSPLDRVDELAELALANFDDDAFITMIGVSLVNGEPTTTVSVGSARQTGEVTFDVDGNIVEVST